MWSQLLAGQVNLRDAIQKKIDFRAANGKEYKLRTDKKLPTLIVRYVPESYLVPYRVLAPEVGISTKSILWWMVNPSPAPFSISVSTFSTMPTNSSGPAQDPISTSPKWRVTLKRDFGTIFSVLRRIGSACLEGRFGALVLSRRSLRPLKWTNSSMN